MSKLLVALAALACLSGCAICNEHPRACMVGAALVAGSVAIAINRHDHQGGEPLCDLATHRTTNCIWPPQDR
jgi:hypothetical protein